MNTLYYIEEFSDEEMPCNPDVDSWAKWLSKPDEEWNRPSAAKYGDTFKTNAMDVHEVIARKHDGEWSFDPEIPPDFDNLVVIDGPGDGWYSDDIAGSVDELLEFLNEDEEDEEDDRARIACMVHHHRSYLFTYSNIDGEPSGSIKELAVQ